MAAVRDSSYASSTELEQGARVLREAILCGDLVPGQKLKQEDLARRLGMSPTPVREILRVLEAEGLLVHVLNKGVYVAESSPADTAEITPIRVPLEGLAVRLGVPRLSELDIATLEGLVQSTENAYRALDFLGARRSNYRFHVAIYRALGSPVLCGMIERLWPRFAANLLPMIPMRIERSIEQHRAILEAIRAQDATRAAELMAEHLSTAGQSIVEYMGGLCPAAVGGGPVRALEAGP